MRRRSLHAPLLLAGALLLPLAPASARPGRGAPDRPAAPDGPTALAAVPAPRSALGFDPGEDRKLASWASIVDYFRALDAASDRVRVEEIGRSTLGRPLLLATISSPENLARLDRLREVQRLLADPRALRAEPDPEAAARRLRAEGRAVVLVTFGVHSTEVGSTLSSTVVAHRLASDDSPETRQILDECVVLLVPSLNPDGVDIVKRWYDASLGKAWEGSSPPELYHHYVGHDDNRDWYALTQAETRAVVERVHNRWHPHVVNDVHEQGPYGSRLFLPPYVDPVEPNVPPEIVSGVNAIGTAVAWSLTAGGMRGIVTNASYDAWTPSRAYSHYHGGLRILSETASARLASPIVVDPSQLESERGYDARVASANFPLPWPGGPWRLADVVGTMTSAVYAVALECARHRDDLLRGFWAIGLEAVTHEAGEPAALLVRPEPELLPPGGGRAAEAVRVRARATLLDALARGGVEIGVASAGFTAGGASYPAGTAVIPYDQPYGAYAKALLEDQRYPDRRAYAGGPPEAPYDVAAHTLSLLSGFRAARVEAPFAPPPTSPYRLDEAAGRDAGSPTRAPGGADPAGGRARVGVYRGATAPIDEGWTRWAFDQFGVPCATIDEADVRAGGLRTRFDAIVLPDMAPRSIAEGRAPGTVPPELAGGLGERGAAELARFVDEGGTLVALNASSDYAIRALALPVRDALAGSAAAAFYCPGSIVALDVADAGSPLVAGIPRATVAWFEGGPGFEVAPLAPRARVVARFAAADRLLVSGWMLGPEKLAGKAALVEVARGRGRVVLFAFRPQYRGQSLVTLPMLLNAVANRGAGA